MLKVVDAKRWSSCGNEFLGMLKEKNIKYNVIYKDLKVFKLVDIDIAGGKKFNILEYHRKSDGQKVLVAHGGFGAGDWCIEEAYVMEIEEGETYTKEEIADTLRNYIKKEEEKECF